MRMLNDYGLPNHLDAESFPATDRTDDVTLLSTLRLIVLAASLLAVIATIHLFDRRVAGVVYLIIFELLGFVRLDLALALTFAAVPFQQDIGGLPIKLSLAELNLVVLIVPLYLRSRSLPVATKLIIPSAAYLAFAVLVTMSKLDSVAVKSLIQMILYIIVAVGVFANSQLNARAFVRCFDALVIITVPLCIAGIVTGFSAFGIHKNAWGASLSLAVVISFELLQTCGTPERRNWYRIALVILTLGLVLTVSRGGWLAAMIGVATLLSLRRDWQTLQRLAIAVVPIALIGWFLLPENLQEYAVGFEKSRYNIQMRWKSIDLALHHFHQSPWFGVGVGLRKQYDATNVALLTLAETGVVGLFLFLLIHANMAWFIWQGHKLLERDSIAFSCFALGGALVAARLAHGMVDHYWSRGAVLAAWAAAGMAIVAWRETQGLHYEELE